MIIKLSLPVQLLFVLIFVVIFGGMLPVEVIQFFFSISLVIKELLGFLLPFMVFAFICTGLLSLQKNALLVMALLFGSIFISNMLTPLLSYEVATTMLPYIISGPCAAQMITTESIMPLWSLYIPKLFSPEWAMLLAFVIGSLVSYFQVHIARKLLFRCKEYIELILKYVFIPVLPLYILGFLLEVHHKGVFFDLCHSYGMTYALIIAMHIFFLALLFWIVAIGSCARAWLYIKNMLPAYLTAFGTMSSTATIPVTISCSQKNVDDSALVQFSTPILANIHLFGDAITIPVLAVVSSYLFLGVIPSFIAFTKFVFYFCLSLFAASGVPGGGILVCVPILKSILGFSDGMIGIIITLHLLQDGFGTAANVMSDGAMTIVVDTMLKRIGMRS